MSSADAARSRVDALLSAVSVAVLVVGLGAVGWGAFGPGPDEPEAVARSFPAAEPTRLRVPSLGIDAPVVPISLGSDAVLDPPADADTVGWWDDSALPGARSGRIVITGHTLHTGGGALNRMVDLESGEVVLRTPTGVRRYEVTDRYVVDYETVAEKARDIFGQTESSPDGARLVLVTCTDFDGTVYRSNVIVVARPV